MWSSTAITRFDTSLPYVQIDTWIDFDLPNPIYMFFDSFFMIVIAMVRINLPSIQTIYDSSDRPDRTALCQGLIRPQQEPIWAPVPSRLLSFVGGHGTVAGDYYGTSAKGTMERIEGIGRDVVSPFPSFPSHTSATSTCIPTIRDDWGRVSVRGALQ